jgi:hypothetical protein
MGVEGMDAFRLVRAIGAAYDIDGVVSVLQFARRLVGTRTIRAVDIRAGCDPNRPRIQIIDLPRSQRRPRSGRAQVTLQSA